jgi:heterotetrameric sarcosine oxidase gamma subunit
MMLQALSPMGFPFGASTLVRGGCREGLSVSECSDFGCVLLTATVDIIDFHEDLLRLTGVEFPLLQGSVAQADGRYVVWLSPRSWLVLCRLDDEPKLLDSINTHFPDRAIHASAFSDYLCWLSLEGEAAEDALRQGGFISLANEGLAAGCARRTLMAGIPVIIHRKTAIHWMIGIERSYALYFSDWLESQNVE